MDEAIINFIRKKYNLLIGESSAEKIKKEIGSAVKVDEEDPVMNIMGRDLLKGIPKEVTINQKSIIDSLSEPVQAIVDAIKEVLEQIPPELSADIGVNGITLTGGGGLLRNLDKVINAATGLSAIVAEDALSCVVRGAGTALEHVNTLNMASSS